MDGNIITRRSPIKRRVFNLIQATVQKSEPFKWLYLLVTYKRGVINEGKYYYEQKQEILHAWEAFTQEDLIADALTY